jgi:hypothetical protein
MLFRGDRGDDYLTGVVIASGDLGNDYIEAADGIRSFNSSDYARLSGGGW